VLIDREVSLLSEAE
jgi:hypothetical protein